MPRAGSTDELERLRLLAADAFAQDMAPAQVAAVLGVAPQTARKWRRVLRAGGRDALRGRPPPGAPCKLDDAQRAALLEDLGRPPSDHGLDGWLWTTRLIAAHIARRFGVAHHHDHVGVILKSLGLSWQRPMRRARERDAAKIAAFRDDAWPGLLKKPPTA